MADEFSKTVLIPCNGLSSCGKVVREMMKMLHSQMPEVDIVDLVPLMAGAGNTVKRAKSATRVIGVAGCQHRCDEDGCQMALGRSPDVEFVVDDYVSVKLMEGHLLTDEDARSNALKALSHLLAKLSEA